MKILCPIDFSNSAVNAANWVGEFLNGISGGQMTLLHCMNVRGRSEMFLRVDDIFLDSAKKDMNTLTKELETKFPNVSISNLIVKSDPKSFVAVHAEKKNFDLIVTGTKGLTALKEMTIGSVTESLIKKSNVPILVIPHGFTYKPVKKICFSVDNKAVWDDTTVAVLNKIAALNKAHIDMIHIKENKDELVEYDLRLDRYLENNSSEYHVISHAKSLLKTVNHFIQENNSGMLAMIHRRKGFFESLFHESITKLELFKLELPFLVLISK